MTGRLVPQSQLTSADLSAMYQLHAAHFEGVTPEIFRRDALQKNWTLLLEKDGRLAGFTTMLAYETTAAGEVASIIYSGDTIVDPSAWGSMALSRLWIQAVRQIRSQYPRGKYYWLLIASGFRTYRFLPLFWREFYPRFDKPTPKPWRQMIDKLATERFDDLYDQKTGVVRFPQPQVLVSSLRGIPSSRLADPNVAFFNSENPGHPDGDELVCLTSLNDDNLTPAGKRMVRT